MVAKAGFDLVPHDEVDVPLEELPNCRRSQMLLRRQQVGVRASKGIKFIGYLPPPFPQCPLQGYQDRPSSVHLPKLLIGQDKVHPLPPGLGFEGDLRMA
jgi:hypothetical protein